MTTWLHRRLRRTGDEGITLVEVIVAMVIFALVSTGFVYSMLSVVSLSRDARAREVAANLAAEEIDLARDAADLFALLDETRTVSLNGDTYHVARSTSWVTNPEDEFSCGGAGGIGAAAGSALRYKRVNVRVTWDHMRGGTEPVQSDTVINPAERINDPTRGTVIVSVLNGAGTGAAGITVSTSPSAGSVIAATDTQGCSYILKVPPGSYTVSVFRSGYVDAAQQTTSAQVVSVVAGQSTTVGFQYDQAATFTARLASTAPAGLTVRVPTNLKTTFTNTYGIFGRTPASGSGTLTPKFTLHPFASGYQAYAGTCDAADPMQWPEEVVAGGTLHGDRLPAQAAVPGGTATIDVPMGLVQIAGVTSNTYLTAVSETPTTPGAPGCVTPETLTFGNVLGAGTTVVALPYGTWKLYRGSSTSQTTLLTGSALSVPAPAVPERTTISATGVVTLDPRVVVAP